MAAPKGNEKFVSDADQRVHRRHLTVCRVGVIHSLSGNHFCRLRNISASGFMARVYHDVAVGDEVGMEVTSGQFLRGSVVWVRDSYVGVEFGSLIDVKSALSGQDAAAAGYLPRLPRLGMKAPARLRQGARYYAASLCDISPGGAQVEMPATLTSGDVCLFLVGLPPIHGTVRWVRECRTGISFNESLGLEPLAAWIRERRKLTSQCQHSREPAGRRAPAASRSEEAH